MPIPKEVTVIREETMPYDSIHDVLPELEVDALGIASLAAWRGTRLEEAARRLPEWVR